MSVDINKKINRVGTPSVKWELIDVGKPEDLRNVTTFYCSYGLCCSKRNKRCTERKNRKKFFGYTVPHSKAYHQSV